MAILAGLVAFVHPAAIARALRGASVGWVAVGLLAYGGFFAARGWRWQIVLQPSTPQATISDATAVTAIGWAINSVAPFKLGDVVRAASMAKRARGGIAEAAATVVLERALDVLALLALAIATGVASGNHRGSTAGGRLAILSVVAAGVAGTALVLVRNESRAVRLVSALTRPLPRLIRDRLFQLALSLLRGFHSLRSWSRFLAAAGLSLAQWALAAGTLFAFFRAVSPQLSPSTLLLALILFTITQAVSVTPGAVGTYEFFFVAILGAFGASPPALLTAIAVLTHVVGTAFLIGCGALGVLWLRLVRPPLDSVAATVAEA